MIALPIFNNVSSDFIQVVTLGTTMTIVRLTWNVRSEFWNMRVSDANDNALATVKLVPYWPLLRQHKGLFPFSGDLMLVRENPGASEFPTFESLGSDFGLYYLTEEEVLAWEDANGLG